MAEEREGPQVDRLIAEIAARHGILLKRDDAAFALVTLNQLVLEDAIKNLVGEIRAATAEFESTFERVQARAGTALANSLRQPVAELQSAVEKCMEGPSATVLAHRNPFSSVLWVVPFAVGLAIGAALRWVW